MANSIEELYAEFEARKVDFEEEFEQCGPMRLYVYAKADQMVDHRFTDDVALTYAVSRKWAVRHFRQLYAVVDKEDVHEVRFNADGVAILTAY